jgi:3alpha(or 20beta)-hydroxysteroid dehydrogenase
MGHLEDKVVIVSGAARGIGAAIVRLFAAEGAAVVAGDILEIPNSLAGERVLPCRLDVRREADWQRAVATALGRWGRITGLVNNAGINRSRPLLEMGLAEFDEVQSINLSGTFLGIRSVAPAIVDAGGGAIVNVSSTAAMQGISTMSAYCASKWGVRGLTKVAALELGPQRVRVNSLHPGGIDTAMGNLFDRPREELNRAYAGQAIPRIGTPEEIAQAALFLLSDAASYLTGAELTVDGGAIAGTILPAMS